MNFVKPTVFKTKGTPPAGLSFLPTLGPDYCDAVDYVEGHHELRQHDQDNSVAVLALVREVATKLPPGSSVLEIGVGAYEPEFSITNTVLGSMDRSVTYFGVDLRSPKLPDWAHFLRTNSRHHDLVREWMRAHGAGPLSLLIIDGDHTVLGALSDWVYASWVEPGGTILVHDSNSHPGPIALVAAIDRDVYRVEEPLADELDYGLAMSTAVLFIGGGRRTQLASYFKEWGCQIFGYELDPRVPLRDYGPVFTGKRWDDPTLKDDLAYIMKGHEIDLAVPLDCRAVGVVAWLPLPKPVVVTGGRSALTCLDKRLFEAAAERFADLYPYPAEGFPAVSKPKKGFGSNGVEYIDRYVPGYQAKFPDNVFQKRLPGPEFSVDAYWNRQGEFVGASPRQRLRVAGGEVLDSITVNRPDLIDAARRVGDAVKLKGPACIQFMDDGAGRPYVIEVNARFGGGSTLSLHAGLNMVEYVLREYAWGKTVEAGSGKAAVGCYMTRSYKDHYFQS